MNGNDCSVWLENAVPVVLESMCFLTVVGEPEEASPLAEPSWVNGSLHFQGDFSGSFGIGAPARTARVLAANFLGEEEEDVTDEQIDEVMREVSNIACGAVLANAKHERPFDLSSPVSAGFPATEGFGPATTAKKFSLEEGPFVAWLEIPA